MFVSEVAMREQRPGHVVLRASKVFAASRWVGTGYSLLYRTKEEVAEFLRELLVGLVVLDYSIPPRLWRPHNRLLEEVVEQDPRWELLGRYPLTRQGTRIPDAISVYRQIGHEDRPVGTIRIDMRFALKKVIQLTK